MKLETMHSKQRRRGFTLIELLLVLVILGVLAGIVVPRFGGQTKRARETAATTQLSSFKTALDAYEVDMGSYPKGKDGLKELVTAPRNAKNWRGPYIETIPKDPWGNDYIYECPGKHNQNSFDLMSMGEDGRVGGEDDIVNWTTK
jgi:general secretion pathway protein G